MIKLTLLDNQEMRQLARDASWNSRRYGGNTNPHIQIYGLVDYAPIRPFKCLGSLIRVYASN